MSSLPSTPLRLTLMCSVVLAGCGASFQHVYEGDVRFEHCYRLDADASVSSQQRLACWSEWSQGHTLGQTLDRVAYARRRQSALQAGEGELAGPTLVTGRPSSAASQAFALRSSGTVATAAATAAATTPATPAATPVTPPSPTAPVATARTTPAPPSSLATAAAGGTTGRTGLVPAAASADAPPLSAHQQCARECGVTFTGCVTKCDGQTCAQRCGAQVRVCLDLCL